MSSHCRDVSMRCCALQQWRGRTRVTGRACAKDEGGVARADKAVTSDDLIEHLERALRARRHVSMSRKPARPEGGERDARSTRRPSGAQTPCPPRNAGPAVPRATLRGTVRRTTDLKTRKHCCQWLRGRAIRRGDSRTRTFLEHLAEIDLDASNRLALRLVDAVGVEDELVSSASG